MLFNDYKNVKTIVFSELPNQEKKKYFNFLLENEINFTRDESGNYVALVKLLNPAFYGKQGDAMGATGMSNSAFEKPETEEKPRSSSQVNRRAGPFKGRDKSPMISTNTKGNFEKKKEEFKTSLQTYNEMFNDKYQKFFKTLKPIIGVRGKKQNLYQLIYNMEEIYSIRFIKDTSSLRNQLTKNNQNVDVKDPFPVFIVEFLTNKYVKKPMIDQHALDLLLSVDYYRKSRSDVEIFSKFLNEEYDTDDLIFFLFVRSCIEKEMKMMFIEKARDEIKIQYQEDRDEIDTELYLNIKTCLKIANTIFGNEEELLLNSFMEKIEKNLTSNQKKGKNVIKASKILEITLEDYHQSRKLYGGEGSNVNLDKFNQSTDNVNVNQEKLKDENLFDEFDQETNDFGDSSGFNQKKRISFNKINNQKSESKPPQSTSSFLPSQEPKNQTEKNNFLKNMIFHYIKERELDIFFEKLIASYSVYEKDNENIENTITTIKDLVGKKLALLISIIFNKDQQNWFISLKIKDGDSQNLRHYSGLVSLMNQMSNYNTLKEIPENLIENFGQTLLSTPELNNQINKLVLKHFG